MSHIRALITSIAVEDLGIPEDVIRAKLPYLLSRPAHQAMPELAALAGKDVGVLDEIMKRRPDATAQRLALFPEVKDVLGRLASCGYTLVLTTNTPALGLSDRLQAVGILHCFRIVLGTDLASGVMKGPEHMRLAAAELGLVVGDLGGVSVLVGDQEGDMRLAKEFGMRAIGRAAEASRERLTAAGADYLIGDLSGLDDALAILDQT